MSLKAAVERNRRAKAAKAAAEAAPRVRIDVYRKGEAPPTWPGKRPQDTFLAIEVPT